MTYKPPYEFQARMRATPAQQASVEAAKRARERLSFARNDLEAFDENHGPNWRKSDELRKERSVLERLINGALREVLRANLAIDQANEEASPIRS